MLTVVHVVGESDIGSWTTGKKDEPQYRHRRAWRDEWCAAVDRAVQQRDAAALHALLASDVSDLLDAVPDTALDVAAIVRDRPSGFEVRPLPKLLDTVSRMGDRPVELVLVVNGNDVDGSVATGPIGEAIVAATLVDTEIFEVPLAACRTVSWDGVDEADLANRLRAELVEGHGRCVLGWGTGGTAFAFAAIAGAVQSGRDLVLLDANTGRPFDLLPAPDPDDRRPHPLAAWLIRLGEVDRFAARFPSESLACSADQRKSAQQLLSLLRDADVAGPNAHPVLQRLVTVDFCRVDRTAVFGVRALAVSEYRNRHTRDGGRDLVSWAEGEVGGTPTLGRVLDALTRRSVDGVSVHRPLDVQTSLRSPSGRFLTGLLVREINSLASSAAHRLGPLKAEMGRLLDGLLRDLPLSRVEQLPSGRVAVIWPIGGRAPFGPTLAASPLGAELTRIVGARQNPTLHCLLLDTPSRPWEVVEPASAQVEAIDGQQTVDGAMVSAESVVSDLDEHAAYQEIQKWLDGATQKRRFDAVIIVPIGHKALAGGALKAALDHGYRHATPVLTRIAGTRVGPRYHSVVPLLAADHVLLDVAVDAMAKLTFDTAAFLLQMGSPYNTALMNDVDALQAQFLDRGNAVSAMRLCVRALTNLDNGQRSGTAADRVRLVHLASSLYDRAAEERNVKGAKRRIRRGPLGRQLAEQRNSLITTHSFPPSKPGEWPGLVARAASELRDMKGLTEVRELVDTYADLVHRIEVRRDEAQATADRWLAGAVGHVALTSVDSERWGD